MTEIKQRITGSILWSDGRYIAAADCRYIVTPRGEIYSLFSASGKRKMPALLTATKTPRGYMMASLRCDDKRRLCQFVHRLVANAFLGLSLGDQSVQVDHIDGDKSNNAVTNLRLVTRAENMAAARARGALKRCVGFSPLVKATLLNLGVYSPDFER